MVKGMGRVIPQYSRLRRVPLLAALPLCVSLLEPAIATPAAKTVGKTAACTVLEKRIAKLNRLPEAGLVGGPGWFCDFASYDDKDWFLIARIGKSMVFPAMALTAAI